MDRVHFQLDGVTNEGEKLREESRGEVFSDSLRKARVEQLAKDRLESLELHEVAAMTEEICELRKLYRELQSNFQRKDLLLDQISLKFLKSEGENRDLISSLSEAFVRIHDLEKKTASASEEISGLKRLLSVKLQLNMEMQQNAMDLNERDECVLKLEEESIVSRDQLNWRNEQFSHLEETHNKLQTLFKESKLEWQKEKSSLLDEISSLQATLDAQVRASDSLEEEVRRNKAYFDESSREVENTRADNIGIDVERVMVELQSKTSEVETLKLRLQKSESEVEIVKFNLEENRRAHEEEKTGLLATVHHNHKDAEILNLEHQISMLHSVILAKSEAAEVLIQEKDNYILLARDRNCSIKNLQNNIARVTKKLAAREVADVAITDADDTLKLENERIVSSTKEKDQKTQEHQEEYQDFFSSASIFLAEDGVLKEAESHKTLEKNRTIANMEKEINRSLEKVELQDKGLIQPMQVASQHEETKKLEIQELRSQLEKETECFDSLLEELESQKHALLEDRSKEKINIENLLPQLENMCQLIGSLCTEDAELMGMLGKLSLLSEVDSEEGSSFSLSDGQTNTILPSRKTVQMCMGERTPLTELNVS